MFKIDVSYAALEQLELNIQYQEANEAYTFIHRIFDAFGRLILNIKTQLLSINKKFKRSELHFYHDSKRWGISNFYNKRYFDRNLMVPIPSGMKVTYITAVDKIYELLEQLSIDKTADILLSYLKDESSSSPGDVTKKISRLTKNDLEKELNKVFSSKKTLDVSLDKAFVNFQEIKEVDTKLLKSEDVFKKIPLICEKLDLIEKEIDRIVTAIENKKDADRAYIKELHVLVRTAAIQFDAFGVCSAELMRVEHNFVLVLEKLVNAAARD